MRGAERHAGDVGAPLARDQRDRVARTQLDRFRPRVVFQSPPHADPVEQGFASLARRRLLARDPDPLLSGVRERQDHAIVPSSQ